MAAFLSLFVNVQIPKVAKLILLLKGIIRKIS